VIFTSPDTSRWDTITPITPVTFRHKTSESNEPMNMIPQHTCNRMKAKAINAATRKYGLIDTIEKISIFAEKPNDGQSLAI